MASPADHDPFNSTDIISNSNTIFGNWTTPASLVIQKHPVSDNRTIMAIVGYWELLVSIIGTPSNILVLYLTLRFLLGRSGRKSTSSSGRRHQSNLWFIFSMTLSDLLFSAIQAPMVFADYVLGVKFGSPSCLTLYIVTHATTVCSSVSLLCLNIDKFLYLNQPLHYHSRVTTRRALAAMLMAWFTSFAWALFFMLGPFTKYTPPCTMRPIHIEWYIAFAVVFFVMPTAVSSAISIYIAYVVMRVKKENEARRTRGTTLIRNGTTGSQVSRSGPAKTTANVKTIAFVFTTTMWSALTYLPYRIAFLLYISPVFPLIRRPWSIPLSYFLVALLATNAAGNPFITILTQRQYSLQFASLFGKGAYLSTSTTEDTTCYDSPRAGGRRTSGKTVKRPGTVKCAQVGQKCVLNGRAVSSRL